MSEYSIGQIFTDAYPEDAADWCNANGVVLVEMAKDAEERRRFQIQTIPSPSQERQEAIIRAERDRRLSECDKISPMRWNSMTEEQRQAWTDYRVALLDITQQDGFSWGGDVSKVPWPVKPE